MTIASLPKNKPHSSSTSEINILNCWEYKVKSVFVQVRLSAWLIKKNYFFAIAFRLGKRSSTGPNIETQRLYTKTFSRQSTELTGAKVAQLIAQNYSNFLSGTLYSQTTGKCNHTWLPQHETVLCVIWSVPGTFQYCNCSRSSMFMKKTNWN